MPESNQHSIKSFFQPPKRPRRVRSDSESDNEENRPRPSKSTRSGLEQQDEESDSNDLYGSRDAIQLHQEEPTSSNDQNQSPISINRPNSIQGTKRSDGRVFPWKNEYKELFPWLDYNTIKGEARCSYRACKMYITIYFFNDLILVFGNEMKWKYVVLNNIKIQMDTKTKDVNQDKLRYLT